MFYRVLSISEGKKKVVVKGVVVSAQVNLEGWFKSSLVGLFFFSDFSEKNGIILSISQSCWAGNTVSGSQALTALVIPQIPFRQS